MKKEVQIDKLYMPNKVKQFTCSKLNPVEMAQPLELVGLSQIQDRLPFDFKGMEENGDKITTTFFTAHKNPFRLSSRKKSPELYRVSERMLAAKHQAKNLVAFAIVDSLNSQKDKSGTPDALDWELYHTEAGGVCAVLDIPHFAFKETALELGELMIAQHREKIRIAKQFCAQYADINYGKTTNILPMARYVIHGTSVYEHGPQVIRLLVPIPSYMQAHDLEPFYENAKYNWLRANTTSTVMGIPFDIPPDAYEVAQKQPPQDGNTNPFAQIQSEMDPNELAGMHRVFTQALDLYGCEYCDINILKKIRCVTPLLVKGKPFLKFSRHGLCVNAPDPESMPRLQQCIASCQNAMYMPSRPNREWSVTLEGISATFDKPLDAEIEFLTHITKKYPKRCRFTDNKLVLLDSKLSQDELHDIGSIIVSSANKHNQKV